MNEVMKTTARLMKISSTGTVKEHLKKKKKNLLSMFKDVNQEDKI